MQQSFLKVVGHGLGVRGRAFRVMSAGCVLVLVSSCVGSGKGPMDVSTTKIKAEKRKAVARRDNRLLVAEKLFSQKSYGLAEREYRAVVMHDSSNYVAWLGLAATYDNLGRFDLALRAYKAAIDIKGATPEILNNLGYHFILKGNLVDARKALTKALKMEPNNEYIKNNMKLLQEREGTRDLAPDRQRDFRSDIHSGRS